MLTLDNFEDMIDREILQRGRSYHKSGHVHSLEEERDGLWTARVIGTDEYEVEIEFTEERLLCECTCPYEWGPYCKHVAAVLYAIRAELQGGKVQVKKKKSENAKLREILEKLPHSDLVDLMMAQLKKDKVLANRLLLQHGDQPPDQAAYARIIKESLRAGMDREGFIDYSSGRRAAKGIWELVNQAHTLIEGRQADKALSILQAIIENVVPMLQYADDSDGEVSGCIEEAFEYLDDAGQSLSGQVKADLLTYCLTEAFEPKYQGWDYPWHFMASAAQLVETQPQQEALFQALDRMAGRRKGYSSDFLGEYDQEQALRLKAEVMQRLKSTYDMHEFLRQNLHLNEARQQLIELYINEKQYKAASQLCLEGITLYRNSKPGLVKEYRHLLLKIAEQQGDAGQIVELAESLLFDAMDFDYYYNLLKATFPKAQWPDFVERLIQKAQKKDPWGFVRSLEGEIYAREGMWKRMLGLVQQEQYGVLQLYRDQLERHFPQEMCAVYEAMVLKQMNRASSRDTYRKVCEYLRRIKKLGKPEQAQAIVRHLIAQYPKRKAMIEELEQV